MKKLTSILLATFFICSAGYCAETASSKTQTKIINTPSLELFGIKLFENVNKHFQDNLLSFENLENVYGITKINDPYLQKIRWLNGDDLVLIKNDMFDVYNIYVNDKLEIEGIDGSNNGEPFNENDKFQICLNKKTALINKIVKFYDLDINKFKVQNYVFSNDERPEEKNDVISKSFFKFKHDGIDLTYALACDILVDKGESIMWIELLTEKLDVAIYSQNYSKTEKSIEQLLDSDLRGL